MSYVIDVTKQENKTKETTKGGAKNFDTVAQQCLSKLKYKELNSKDEENKLNITDEMKAKYDAIYSKEWDNIQKDINTQWDNMQKEIELFNEKLVQPFLHELNLSDKDLLVRHLSDKQFMNLRTLKVMGITNQAIFQDIIKIFQVKYMKQTLHDDQAFIGLYTVKEAGRVLKYLTQNHGGFKQTYYARDHYCPKFLKGIHCERYYRGCSNMHCLIGDDINMRYLVNINQMVQANSEYYAHIVLMQDEFNPKE